MFHLIILLKKISAGLVEHLERIQEQKHKVLGKLEYNTTYVWKYYMYLVEKYSWKYTVPTWNDKFNKLDDNLKLKSYLQDIYAFCYGMHGGITTLPGKKLT